MRLAVVCLVLAAAAACQKRDEPAKNELPPMTPAEMDQGSEICKKWAARICRCAEQDPARFKDPCELARSQPDGLELQLRALRGERGTLSSEERRIFQAGAARFIQACLTADNELDRSVCPRE
jgi:hypothetical protein